MNIFASDRPSSFGSKSVADRRMGAMRSLMTKSMGSVAFEQGHSLQRDKLVSV
jgi:hypothetical protein